MERYNQTPAVKQAEDIEAIVWRGLLTQQRLMKEAVYNSEKFTQLIKDVEMFLVLRLTSSSSMKDGIGKLADVLRRFGAPTTYGQLAKLVFPNYADSELTATGNGELLLKIYLLPDLKQIKTQSGEHLITQDGKRIVAATRSAEQNRNDFVYLVNYLAPNFRRVTVEYLGA